ncbi:MULTISPECIES: type II toxin-antitoxin system HicA family toxin [Limnospira]|nr:MULTISPECIES: type II toxin-antitoxin system HicA family toxin [unclassified Limnospira]MDY7051967.1 type II toxin-antitoxin system HicA family toxin [Limnospira fusiformis LS22]
MCCRCRSFCVARNFSREFMKYREVARKLKALGCQELPRRGGGSHRKWLNPNTGQASVLPDWGSRDLKIGTLRSALRQLGIDWDVFNNT